MTDFKRMNTGVERVFRPTREPGVYQEVFLHFLHFLAEDGSLVRSKLEKQLPGKLYREQKENEKHLRSPHGQVEYTFPNGETKVLLALSMTFNDTAYGIQGRYTGGGVY